ncbi:MAG: hypothetical protein AAF589_05945 [Planctomycetota bacterium]
MTPKWLTKASASVLGIGLLVLIAGPIVLAQVAPPAAGPVAEPPDDPEALEKFKEQRLEELHERFGVLIWVVPVAGAMVFSGMIGLLLVWVSRPLGDDLEKSQAAEDRPETGS